MALFGLGKKSSSKPSDAGDQGNEANGNGGNGNTEAGGGESPEFQPDPRKARAWLDRAHTVADTGNHEYAIECYLQGLRHNPDNLAEHEALRDVALKRKVKGGKPAGLKDRLNKMGSDPIAKLLHAEKLWSMDPLNLSLMLDTMGAAVDADRAYPDLSIGEVAFWVGETILGGQTAKPGKKKDYLATCEHFKSIGRFDKAVEAMKRAIRLAPNDDTLLAQLKDLEAERTMQEGRYGGGQEGDFRANIRDAEKQRDLELGDAKSAGGSQIDELIARRKAEFEEDPDDLDKLQKLVDVLIRKESNAEEKQAIDLLNKAWESSGQYRFKVRAGDITMKQINRYVRQLKQMVDAAPEDEEYKKRYHDTLLKKLAFELQEYTDRVKNYPTDLSLKHELGKRLFQAGKFDDAIGMFQQAKQDPKARASSHIYLGRCYVNKGWLDEALDTLGEGVAAHPLNDDTVALDLRYLKMDAHIRAAEKNNSAEHAEEARKLASYILQANINFRDIKQRVDQIRALMDKLADGE